MSAERQKVVSEKPARVYEHPLFTYVNDQKALCVKGRTVHLTRRESQLMQVLSTVRTKQFLTNIFSDFFKNLSA